MIVISVCFYTNFSMSGFFFFFFCEINPKLSEKKSYNHQNVFHEWILFALQIDIILFWFFFPYLVLLVMNQCYLHI